MEPSRRAGRTGSETSLIRTPRPKPNWCVLIYTPENRLFDLFPWWPNFAQRTAATARATLLCAGRAACIDFARLRNRTWVTRVCHTLVFGLSPCRNRFFPGIEPTETNPIPSHRKARSPPLIHLIPVHTAHSPTIAGLRNSGQLVHPYVPNRRRQ